MTGRIEDWLNDIHCGDAMKVLREMPASSVHMAMCSPPYFGLRDYGEDGQIGLEDSLDQYITNLVEVGEELRRVLRGDGSWWLNLGDSYSGSWGAQSHDASANHEAIDTPDKNPARHAELGRKQKMLVPHRVAIALQESGWVVRNDVTWVKPNPMPSSVKDRLNTTTEQVFHLTPEPDYWYDLDAVREPHATSEEEYIDKLPKGDENKTFQNSSGSDINEYSTDEAIKQRMARGKNPGDVFEVTTKPFPDAHFAVYPPELCEKPIKATAPPKVCAECGAGYVRDVDRETVYDHETTEPTGVSRDRNDTNGGNGHDLRNGVYSEATFNGWKKQCSCDTDATEPGIVLDPFAGAGTTCLVAKRLGRRFVGIDLNPEYVAMAQKRVGVGVDEPELLRDNGDTGIEEFVDGMRND